MEMGHGTWRFCTSRGYFDCGFGFVWGKMGVILVIRWDMFYGVC